MFIFITDFLFFLVLVFVLVSVILVVLLVLSPIFPLSFSPFPSSLLLVFLTVPLALSFYSCISSCFSSCFSSSSSFSSPLVNCFWNTIFCFVYLHKKYQQIHATPVITWIKSKAVNSVQNTHTVPLGILRQSVLLVRKEREWTPEMEQKKVTANGVS